MIKMSPIMLLFAVLCFAVMTVLEASEVYYDLTGYSTYEWGKGYPQSCECAESGVSLSSCNLFKCKCICDVTAGKCDYNCCCDPDCTADQVSKCVFPFFLVFQFSSTFVCPFKILFSLTPFTPLTHLTPFTHSLSLTLTRSLTLLLYVVDITLQSVR